MIFKTLVIGAVAAVFVHAHYDEIKTELVNANLSPGKQQYRASAQQPKVIYSAEQIISALLPQPRTRSFRNFEVEQSGIDLTIHFDFDSARLRQDSIPQLQELVRALSSDQLADYKFRVEGHTDAKGTADYNQNLSERRADAVVAFLRSNGVSADNLDAVGKGFNELRNRRNPYHEENRRVRVVTLDS